MRTLENDEATVSKSKTDKVLKEITETLASLQREVKSIKDSQKQSLQSTASNNQEGQIKSKPPKCYHCGKLGHYKSKCRYYLATKDGQNESQFQKKSVAGGYKKSKNSRDGNVAHLSCGTSEILCKAGESGMFVDVKIRDNILEFLVDTGATVTLVSKSAIEKIGPITSVEPLKPEILIADGTPLKVYGTQLLEFSLQGAQFTQKIVVADLSVDGILGLDFLRSNNCRMDLSKGSLNMTKVEKPINCKYKGKIGFFRVTLCENVSIPPMSEIVTYGNVKGKDDQDNINIPKTGILESSEQFQGSDRALVARTLVDGCPENKVPIRLMNLQNEATNLGKGTFIAELSPVDGVINLKEDSQTDVKVGSLELPDHLHDLFERCSENLSVEQKEIVLKLLLRYHLSFSSSDRDLGRTDVIRHKINTGNNRPIKQVPRRIPANMQKEVDAHIDDMLQRNVIEPSCSPWASNIVLVKKKDGTTRFCIDYCKLNNVTIHDAYPLPRIDDSLDQLRGAKWFSTLDLCSGYWQVAVDPNDRQKTAFTTRRGLFEFSVMPFGLCNAPATFERLMETVLRRLQCLIYLDDNCVWKDI